MEKIDVMLKKSSYSIFIGYSIEIFKKLSDLFFLKSTDRVMIVTNDIIAEIHLNTLYQGLNDIGVSVDISTLPDGEEYKTLGVVNKIYSKLLDKQYSRDTTIIAFGGGVIGDMAGFAASTYQRGIKFIQFPTTLLAQIDASIGGKTGVNHALGKNMIGTFYQPKSVVINIDYLKTLPVQEVFSAMAEIIKYAIIFDEKFLTWLEKNIDDILSLKEDVIITCIKYCCQFKVNIVQEDEFDQGIRSILNLGHTYAHAIETFVGYGKWRHGEAVSVGLIMSMHLSLMLGFFSISELKRVKELLLYIKLPISGPKEMKPEDYLMNMKRDKKIISGIQRLIIPVSIGKVIIYSDIISEDLLINAIKNSLE